MKNILIIFGLLVNSVYGQNLKPVEVNDDSMNLYFGKLLNTERVKLGKQELKYDITLKIVEDSWVESYFTKIINYDNYMDSCGREKIQPTRLFGSDMHGEGKDNYSSRYEKKFGKLSNGTIGENMLVTNSGGSILNYDSLTKQIFRSWVDSKRHYQNMTNTETGKFANGPQYCKYDLVVKQLKYNGTVYYMSALFMKS